MAEREGFEPPDPFESMVFKTTAFDHSATSPNLFVFDVFVTFIYLPGLKRWFPPRYSGLPALRPSGRTSCVLICSGQISRPLSYLSGFQWQVTSGKWSGYSSPLATRYSPLYFEGAIIRELSVVSMQIMINLLPGFLIFRVFTGLYQTIGEHQQNVFNQSSDQGTINMTSCNIVMTS